MQNQFRVCRSSLDATTGNGHMKQGGVGDAYSQGSHGGPVTNLLLIRLVISTAGRGNEAVKANKNSQFTPVSNAIRGERPQGRGIGMERSG